MKPYYDHANITIYHGDCLDVMPQLDPVDMILADPPYGTTACAWDTVIPFEPMWKQLKRLIKPNGAIVMTAGQPFTSALIMSNIKMFKYCWVWMKNRGSNLAVVKYQPMKEHEDIAVFGKGRTQYSPIKESRKGSGLDRVKYGFNGSNTGKRETMGSIHDARKGHMEESLRFPSSIQKFNTEVGLHPTQKPVALMEYLIKTYTNSGETILDFTMGSGTTLFAAKNLGCKAIGIELEEEYCEIAVRRLEQEVFDFGN